MRISCLTSTALAAALFAIAGAIAPSPAAAQLQFAEAAKAPTPAPAPQQAPAPGPPKPYKVVAVKQPEAMKDPSFDAFRKQLITIAQKKDKAGLARLVARNFF